MRVTGFFRETLEMYGQQPWGNCKPSAWRTSPGKFGAGGSNHYTTDPTVIRDAIRSRRGHSRGPSDPSHTGILSAPLSQNGVEVTEGECGQGTQLTHSHPVLAANGRPRKASGPQEWRTSPKK